MSDSNDPTDNKPADSAGLDNPDSPDIADSPVEALTKETEDALEENTLEEDFSLLEDAPEDSSVFYASDETEDNPQAVNSGPVTPGTPVYRLRLPYSSETCNAAYRGETLSPGSIVLIPTRYGKDIATVTGQIQCRAGCGVVWIERVATPQDIEKRDANFILEQEAFKTTREKIIEHKLDMKLVRVHYMLHESKILFFFTAEARVDFRELVKDLVNIFKMRIELRQIGVRDEARIISGVGVCGRCYCCSSISDKLKPVTIKMAKDQNISFNSMKISGACGRLLCCLSYEHSFYSEQLRVIPQAGTKVTDGNEIWVVTDSNMITGKVKMTNGKERVLILPAGNLEKVDKVWRIKQH
jgi:cell fate regulator YaaT (PSP1 superfamily)